MKMTKEYKLFHSLCFVLCRPPIRCLCRCTTDSLSSLPIENITGHKATNNLCCRRAFLF